VKTKLEHTRNFLDLYVHHCGRSEVPSEFHLWCGLALVAASVRDRVWLEKFRYSRIKPNLYTILIGPSGVGKGVAIEQAIKFVKDHPQIGLYAGESTSSYMLSHLAGEPYTDQGQTVDPSKMFLVTEELSMSVGDGPPAVDFIKHMTGLYNAGAYPIRKGTVTRGSIMVESPCMNWLAGSTREWLIESVPKSAIEGGFLGRCIIAKGQYDFEVRHRRPWYPEDAELIADYLHGRIEQLCAVEGEFKMTPGAIEVEELWYMHRPVPQDEAMIPTWKREHDLVLKLSMVLALCDSVNLVVTRQHMIHAQSLSALALRNAPEILALAQSSKDNATYQWVRDKIKSVGTTPHFVLLRQGANRGVTADQLKMIIQTLVQQRVVKVIHQRPGADGGAPGLHYQWVSGASMVSGDVPEAPEAPEEQVG
jgi:hypothetical protein